MGPLMGELSFRVVLGVHVEYVAVHRKNNGSKLPKKGQSKVIILDAWGLQVHTQP